MMSYLSFNRLGSCAIIDMLPFSCAIIDRMTFMFLVNCLFFCLYVYYELVILCICMRDLLDNLNQASSSYVDMFPVNRMKVPGLGLMPSWI